MPRPLRTSCNRCHSQKLRCPKEVGTSICTRCAKAGTPCVFSPAGPIVRRSLASTGRDGNSSFATPPLDVDFGTDFAWPLLDFDGLMSPRVEPPPPAGPQSAISSETDISLTNPISICARQLSELAHDIDRIYSTMPAHASIHVSKDGPLPELAKQWADKYSQRQCLEQLFASSQLLIEIYPRAIELIFNPHQDHVEECQDETCIHRQGIPPQLEESFKREDVKKMPVDSFLINLLILCHTRFTDVLDVMLLHVQTCAKIALALPDLKEPELDIPELRVGSFVASPQSASAMQLVLFVHLTTVLLDRAKQLNKRVNEASGKYGSTKQALILKLQCEALVEGAESKVSAVQKIRAILIELGFIV